LTTAPPPPPPTTTTTTTLDPCTVLNDLLEEMRAELDEFKRWSKEAFDPDKETKKDPDLAEQVQNILKVSAGIRELKGCKVSSGSMSAAAQRKKKRGGAGAGRGAGQDGEGAGDGGSSGDAADDAKNGSGNGSDGGNGTGAAAGGGRDGADSGSDGDGIEYDDTPGDDDMVGITNWMINMNGATRDFDTKVHPHGAKWWRYRWQYSIVEEIYLCFLWWLVYAFYRLFKYMGMQCHAKVYRLRDPGQPNSHFQYVFFFVMFHASIIAVLGLSVWILHETTSFFDGFAILMRSWLVTKPDHDGAGGGAAAAFLQFAAKAALGGKGDRASQVDIPFVGESYYVQLLDMLFHLLSAFLLHALAMSIIIRRWVHTCSIMEELNNFQKEHHTPRGVERKYPEMEYYQGFYDEIEGNFYKAIEKREDYRKTFIEFDVPLTPGVEGAAFEFNNYLEEVIGRSASQLTTLEFYQALFLSIFFFFIALIAYNFKLSFRYFLEPLGVVTLLFCGGILFFYRHLKGRSEAHDVEMKPFFVTLKMWAKSTQVMFYILFYSLSRLILSRDMWHNYFWNAVWASIFLVVFFLLVKFVLADVMQVTAFVLSLPPNIDQERFYRHVKYLISKIEEIHPETQEDEAPNKSLAHRLGKSASQTELKLARGDSKQPSPRGDRSPRDGSKGPSAPASARPEVPKGEEPRDKSPRGPEPRAKSPQRGPQSGEGSGSRTQPRSLHARPAAATPAAEEDPEPDRVPVASRKSRSYGAKDDKPPGR
jgi:hypothetical protein